MGIAIVCDKCGSNWYKDTDWPGDQCPYCPQHKEKAMKTTELPYSVVRGLGKHRTPHSADRIPTTCEQDGCHEETMVRVDYSGGSRYLCRPCERTFTQGYPANTFDELEEKYRPTDGQYG